MATKTISITEKAYNKLARLKGKNESFSIVIERISGKKRKKLSDYAGILSKESGEKFEKGIKIIRKRREKAYLDRIKRIKRNFS